MWTIRPIDPKKELTQEDIERIQNDRFEEREYKQNDNQWYERATENVCGEEVYKGEGCGRGH